MPLCRAVCRLLAARREAEPLEPLVGRAQVKRTNTITGPALTLNPACSLARWTRSELIRIVPAADGLADSSSGR